MKGKMRVHYDEEGDFLEVAVGDPVKCYAEEVEPGVFLRREEETDEIRSIGVLGFKNRSTDPADFDLDLPVDITLSA